MFPGGRFQFLGARYTFRTCGQDTSIICGPVIILGTVSSFLGERRFLGSTRYSTVYYPIISHSLVASLLGRFFVGEVISDTVIGGKPSNGRRCETLPDSLPTEGAPRYLEAQSNYL
jgi:hypothetical protein